MKKGFWIWVIVLFCGSLVCSALIAYQIASNEGGNIEDWALTNMETGEIIPFTETVEMQEKGIENTLFNIILENQDGKIIFMGEMSRERQYITGELLCEGVNDKIALMNRADGSAYPLKKHLSAIVTSDYYISLTEQEKARYRLAIFYCPIR